MGNRCLACTVYELLSRLPDKFWADFDSQKRRPDLWLENRLKTVTRESGRSLGFMLSLVGGDGLGAIGDLSSTVGVGCFRTALGALAVLRFAFTSKRLLRSGVGKYDEIFGLYWLFGAVVSGPLWAPLLTGGCFGLGGG